MAENLMKDLFQQLPLGCWNLNNSDQSTQFSIQISSDTSNPMMNNNILERILEKASTKQLKRILDVTKEKQDRFLSVAKIVDVNEKVLTRLGVISGLSKSDAEMRITFVDILMDCFLHWEKEPDDLEKKLVEKYQLYCG